MKTQRVADIISGCLLSLLGLVIVRAALQIPGSREEHLPPGTLPYVLGWIILAAGIVLAASAWCLRGENTVIRWPDRAGTMRILVTVASLTVSLAAMEPLGLPLSTLLFVSFLSWYLGRYRVAVAVFFGLAFAAGVFFVFIGLLELPFPVGPLARFR